MHKQGASSASIKFAHFRFLHFVRGQDAHATQNGASQRSVGVSPTYKMKREVTKPRRKAMLLFFVSSLLRV
jgi:hypothetical protein